MHARLDVDECLNIENCKFGTCINTIGKYKIQIIIEKYINLQVVKI